jgi:hypothetical protein
MANSSPVKKWTSETAPRVGRPPASKGFSDALARFADLTDKQFLKVWDKRETFSIQEKVALNIVNSVRYDNPEAKDIDAFLNRLIGKPKNTMEVSGPNAAPLKIEIVDSRAKGVGV